MHYMMLQMENVIIYLLGYPGVGKLTIANKISTCVKNTHVVDNHKINNLIFPFVDLSKDLNDHPLWPYIGKIRDVVFRFIVNEADAKHNFIFTAFLLEEEKHKVAYNKMLNLAEQRQAKFIPVKLLCDKDIIKKRMQSEERKQNFKLTDTKILDDYFINRPGLININHPNLLSLDITNLNKTAVKDKIITWVESCN